MKTTCGLCGKPRKEFETEEIHHQVRDTSQVSRICRHCILDLKRQLSLFNLTFWVEDGKGHFNAHANAAAFYVNNSRVT